MNINIFHGKTTIFPCHPQPKMVSCCSLSASATSARSSSSSGGSVFSAGSLVLDHVQWEIFRILKWRYCTIFLAIFCGDIPLHRPYVGLIYGRYLQFRILELAIDMWFHRDLMVVLGGFSMVIFQGNSMVI